MSWLLRIARSEKERIKRNLSRLEDIRSLIHDLSYFVVASNSGGYKVLEELIDDRVVAGRPLLHQKLQSALLGENNQKVALDAPTRFSRIMGEAEELVKREIGKEQKVLRQLDSE